jgi:hypothetical protein
MLGNPTPLWQYLPIFPSILGTSSAHPFSD